MTFLTERWDRVDSTGRDLLVEGAKRFYKLYVVPSRVRDREDASTYRLG